jgi:hypothetical protein
VLAGLAEHGVGAQRGQRFDDQVAANASLGHASARWAVGFAALGPMSAINETSSYATWEAAILVTSAWSYAGATSTNVGGHQIRADEPHEESRAAHGW